MSSSLVFKCLLAGAVCLAAGVSQAADRPVRVLYFQAPPEAPEQAFVYVGSNTLLGQTELPRFNFSETFEIPNAKGALKLRFLPRELAEDEKIPEAAPWVRIPPDWTKILLLVHGNEANTIMPIKVEAINASDNAFGPGSIYMLNMSNIRIGGMVGDKKLDLRPRSVKILKDPIRENGFYPTKLFAITAPGEKPQRFIKQMWEKDSAVRQVLFIMPKPPPQHATYYTAPVRDL